MMFVNDMTHFPHIRFMLSWIPVATATTGSIYLVPDSFVVLFTLIESYRLGRQRRLVRLFESFYFELLTSRFCDGNQLTINSPLGKVTVQTV